MKIISVLDSWSAAGWTGSSLYALQNGALTRVREQTADDSIVAHLDGTLLPGFTDHHVHLDLVDRAALAPGGIARVVDLGTDPARFPALIAEGLVDIGEFAGAFLTAKGGYPVGRVWAPAGAIREVMSAKESAAAVDEMAVAGASVIKIALNSGATGTDPVWDDRMLASVVRLAHEAGMPVVAHAEGPGAAMRAIRAGADRLAHTPWTERLSDDELREAAETCSWISTLDIHGWGDRGEPFAVALDNLRRFVAVGGTVHYGTDLGNGPLPIGINTRELEALVAAGLSMESIVGAIAPARSGGRLSVISGPVNHDRSVLADWLSTATVHDIGDLEETFG